MKSISKLFFQTFLIFIGNKKHVLIEKPAGKNSSELNELIKEANKNQVLVHVGFNHRYHRSVIKACEIIDAGQLGELMFLRARYGHGGRLQTPAATVYVQHRISNPGRGSAVVRFATLGQHPTVLSYGFLAVDFVERLCWQCICHMERT